MSRRRQAHRDSHLQVYEESVWESPEFIPSFSVRRKVLLEDGVAEKVHHDIKRRLKLSGSHKVHGYVVAPHEMCLVTIEQQALIKQLRVAGVRDNLRQFGQLAEKMENVAAAIQFGLSRILQNTSPDLNLALDGPKLFQGGKAIGCGPYAWKGYGANYCDPSQINGSPNELLVAEKQVCIGAIAAAFGSNEDGQGIDIRPLLGEPHVALLSRGSALQVKKFQPIEKALSAIVPEELRLSDPVIYLQNKQGAAAIEFPIWPRHVVDGQLKLVA